MKKKLTSSLFTSLETFSTNSIFLWSIDEFFPFTICGRQNEVLPLVKYNIMNQIKYNELAAPLFSTTEKIYLTFCDTNNYKNGKYNSCAASIFNETIFLEENTASLSIQKKERKRKLTSKNHLGDTKFN